MKQPFRIWRVIITVAAVVAIAIGVAWNTGALQPFKLYRPSNAIMVVAPYKYAGTWVIDDPAVGLNREPFVAGIPEMIDAMVKDIPDSERGFRMLFSTHPFPGYSHKLTWRHGDESGNWYYCEQLGKEGWLCPGLFKYYRNAPPEIFVKAEKK